MRNSGFIKSWRKELESDIWSMPPLYHRVWHYLLRSVSWEKNIFPTRNLYGIHLNPGQQLYSIQQIAEGVSWVERNVKKTPNKKTILNILSWLEFHRAVVRESNGNGTFVSICNWERYQSEGNVKVTAKVTQSIPQSTHTKEVKEEKKRKDIITNTPTSQKANGLFSAFYSLYPRKVGKQAAEKAWLKNKCDEHSDQIMEALPKHIDSKDWQKSEGQFVPHPSTWLNGRRWEDQIEVEASEWI